MALNSVAVSPTGAAFRVLVTFVQSRNYGIGESLKEGISKLGTSKTGISKTENLKWGISKIQYWREIQISYCLKRCVKSNRFYWPSELASFNFRFLRPLNVTA